MVALAIVALLLLLGMPSFTTFVRNSEIRSTSESIINGLRAATTEAANRNKKVTFELASATGADWKFWVFDDDGVTKKTIQSYSKKEAGPNTKITITPAGQTSVTFNGLGRVDIDPANPDNHLRQIDIDSVVAGEARPLRIIVDDPEPAGCRETARAPHVRPRPRACRTRPPIPGPVEMKHPPLSAQKRSAPRQTGSYLLEALIAILIFSFGVLGLIGLLGSSIRVTNDARYRSEAANLAGAMIADMWTMTAAQMDTRIRHGRRRSSRPGRTRRKPCCLRRPRIRRPST